MKEYWTDTILEDLVPAGTDVERGGPVRIYKADDVAELARRVLNYPIYHDQECVSWDNAPTYEGAPCDCGANELVAELKQIVSIIAKK